MRVPSYVGAIWSALSFSSPQTSTLRDLSAADWDLALDFCDRNHLTTALAMRCGAELPPAISARLAANLINNEHRLRKFEEAYLEIADVFSRAGVEWLVLKGFSHWPEIGVATRHRQQYDIDLFCPPQQLAVAHRALNHLGYRPLAGVGHLALDHLPAMVRPSNWQWRSDFFDVEIPCRIELHHRLWDPSTERLAVSGLEQFWQRRVTAGRPGLSFPAFAAPDLAGYAALHLLRHLLRGDLPPFHVYDLAWFLHSHAEDRELWNGWHQIHASSLRKVELILFQIARQWFGCHLPQRIEDGIAKLPAPVRRWLELYSFAPLEAQFHPNKHELWLHLALIEKGRDQRAVFLRRVLPARLPAAAEVRIEGSELRAPRYWRKVIGRAVHHLRLLIPACVEGLRWWWHLRDKAREDRALAHSHS